MVNHTDDSKEEGCHQTVGQHLDNGTGDGGLGYHAEGEEHHTAVGYRAIGIDVLEVGLHTG